MPKKKYYAVRVGKVPGIYSAWNECKMQIDGISGAQYKSFSSLKEAEQYIQETTENNIETTTTNSSITDLNTQIESRISALRDNEIIAFVDGSYDATGEKSAFGVVIFSCGGNKNILYKSFNKQLGAEFISFRNVSAELEGVKEAICWAIQYGKRKIVIYYDYEGIEKWATGQWKAKKTITKEYVAFIQEKSSVIEIEFVKVPAHTGIEFNEEVDLIAKNALLAKGHKTYNDGSVYFVGYGFKDWEEIVKNINNENKSLSKNEIAPVSIDVEKIGAREKIKITQLNNKVTINCYKNSKSYVQGKQTVLFQKIIETAIEWSKNQKSAIETLNNYHALTINADEVEKRFEQLLPHYKGKYGRHYTILLSAVFNTMLTGYMPEYTCLVTPIFRAYEYYLHRILGDIMGLETETDKGINNFAFFSKKSSKTYECNNSKKNILSSTQLDYLNKLYSQYNSVRHAYSHWSADDEDAAVITDIKIARQMLLDGLNLADQYYILFER